MVKTKKHLFRRQKFNGIAQPYQELWASGLAEQRMQVYERYGIRGTWTQVCGRYWVFSL